MVERIGNKFTMIHRTSAYLDDVRNKMEGTIDNEGYPYFREI